MRKLGDKAVLLIDDDLRMFGPWKRFWRGKARLFPAPNGRGPGWISCMNRKARTPHLVITDLRMPHMAGVMTGLTMVYAIHAIFPMCR